jgi:hypothetical protein
MRTASTARTTRITRITRITRAMVATAASLVLLATCGAPRPGLSNGSVSACYRAIPTARTAVNNSHATLIGVHRVPIDQVEGSLSAAAQTELAGDNDTTVCALSFRGPFVPGEVALAPSDAKGKYAVILVTSRHLHLLASSVLDDLPRSLGKRTL